MTDVVGFGAVEIDSTVYYQCNISLMSIKITFEEISQKSSIDHKTHLFSLKNITLYGLIEQKSTKYQFGLMQDKT